MNVYVLTLSTNVLTRRPHLQLIILLVKGQLLSFPQVDISTTIGKPDIRYGREGSRNSLRWKKALKPVIARKPKICYGGEWIWNLSRWKIYFKLVTAGRPKIRYRGEEIWNMPRQKEDLKPIMMRRYEISITVWRMDMKSTMAERGFEVYYSGKTRDSL